MSQIPEKILKELKEANNFELKQTDSFTSQTQLIFFIAVVILGTSFLSINSDNLIITISKLIIFFIILIALYFTMPYLKSRKYKICPDIENIVRWLKDDGSYNDFIIWLIEIYKDNYLHNENENLKRESDFKRSAILLAISALLLFILFGYYFLFHF